MPYNTFLFLTDNDIMFNLIHTVLKHEFRQLYVCSYQSDVELTKYYVSILGHWGPKIWANMPMKYLNAPFLGSFDLVDC